MPPALRHSGRSSGFFRPGRRSILRIRSDGWFAGGRHLNGKDFINIGIFTALYFVVVFAVACLGFVPILMALICGIVPLIAGIPYMLYLTKVRKFGMITILGLLIGIIMFITGMGYFSIATGLVFGLIADLVWKSGGYTSASRAILSHGIFSCWIIGNFLPFLITADTPT